MWFNWCDLQFYMNGHKLGNTYITHCFQSETLEILVMNIIKPNTYTSKSEITKQVHTLSLRNDVHVSSLCFGSSHLFRSIESKSHFNNFFKKLFCFVRKKKHKCIMTNTSFYRMCVFTFKNNYYILSWS